MLDHIVTSIIENYMFLIIIYFIMLHIMSILHIDQRKTCSELDKWAPGNQILLLLWQIARPQVSITRFPSPRGELEGQPTAKRSEAAASGVGALTFIPLCRDVDLCLND